MMRVRSGDVVANLEVDRGARGRSEVEVVGMHKPARSLKLDFFARAGGRKALLGTQYTYGEPPASGGSPTLEGVRFDATDALEQLRGRGPVEVLVEVRGHDGRERTDEVLVLDGVRLRIA